MDEQIISIEWLLILFLALIIIMLAIKLYMALRRIKQLEYDIACEKNTLKHVSGLLDFMLKSLDFSHYGRMV